MSMEPPTQALLLLAYQQSARDLEHAIRSGGHVALRPKHGAVFGQLARRGTRATVLARGAGMTKAAMGELVDELQELGYVKRERDPSDRRAKLVLPTAAGLDVLRILNEFNDHWEKRHRKLLGRDAYQSLRSSLLSIASPASGKGRAAAPAARQTRA